MRFLLTMKRNVYNRRDSGTLYKRKVGRSVKRPPPPYDGEVLAIQEAQAKGRTNQAFMVSRIPRHHEGNQHVIVP